MDINLSNDANRDAKVTAQSVTAQNVVRWLDETGGQAMNSKLLRATLGHDLDALLAEHDGDLEAVAQALVAGDPEIDIESYGSSLYETSRVYVDGKREIVHRIARFEVVLDPAGNEVTRRPRKVMESNVAGEIPLQWTGRRVPRQAAVRRFFFTGLLQITHINGLTYDFLYDMAKDLAEKDELMLVGGGVSGKDQLVFRRNTPAYTAFLEGRVDGDRYALLLHLTNMELKTPEEEEVEDEPAG